MIKKKLTLLIPASFLILAICISFAYEKLDTLTSQTDYVPAIAINENHPMHASANGAIVFSHPDHFYQETIHLTFEAENDDISAIYYTLDGTPPDGETGSLYTDALRLAASSRLSSYIIKVCGQREDGTYSSIQTHSYFIGFHVFDRFDTLVFSLSTDPYNLYDDVYGIAVPGILREEYIAETGDEDPDPPAPANYNMRGRDTERPVYVELIDSDGQLILAQNAGMRVHGGWSRALDQKTFRLYARSIYDEENKNFDFDFFPNDFSYYGRPILSYDRLLLRNNANDNPFAFLRDETVSELASAMLPDTQSSRAAAVFLNGEYYGFVWVRQYYDHDYLNDKNEMKNGEWVILGGSETYKHADPQNPLEVLAAKEYQEIYDLHHDLQDDRVLAELFDAIDIENFLAYYAIQVYVNNCDWTWGNYRVYRYYGKDDSKIHDGISTADGKWRWLLYDTDWTLGLYDSKASDPSLGRILRMESSDRGYSPLLLALMNREDMRGRFAAVLCDVMNHHFTPEKIEEMVRKKEAERENELYFNFRDGGAQLKDTWSSLKFVAGQVESIIDFGKARPAEMRKQIEKYLEVDPSGYTIHCKPHEFADIKLGTCEITEDFSGFYYDISTVTLSARKPDGYSFSHWLVNGEMITDEILTVGKENAFNGIINIELVVTVYGLP